MSEIHHLRRILHAVHNLEQAGVDIDVPEVEAARKADQRAGELGRLANSARHVDIDEKIDAAADKVVAGKMTPAELATVAISLAGPTTADAAGTATRIVDRAIGKIAGPPAVALQRNVDWYERAEPVITAKLARLGGFVKRYDTIGQPGRNFNSRHAQLVADVRAWHEGFQGLFDPLSTLVPGLKTWRRPNLLGSEPQTNHPDWPWWLLRSQAAGANFGVWHSNQVER